MREQQEGYRPPVAEIQEGEPEVSAAQEAAMPSVEYLDVLLHESENVAMVASMSEQEIDEMVERWQKSLDRLQNVEVIRESRLQRVENFNPLGDLKSSDYERLTQEGMIDASYAERLEKIDEVIAKLEALDYPSADAQAQLEQLSEVRNSFREKLEGYIAERQQEIATRREEVKNKVLEHYVKRTKALERTIAEIGSNPRVVERLQAIAEKEMQAAFAKREAERKAFEAKIEQERKVIIQEATRYVHSLGARHSNAFKRLGELLGNDKVAEELMAALDEEDAKKQQSAFDRVKRKLMHAVIDGEGDKQLKDPREVVPWENKTTSMPYYFALNGLKDYSTKEALEAAVKAGDKNAQSLLEQIERVIKQDRAFFTIFDKKWARDKKTGEKRMGAFWAAFETRKKNDKEGVTAARKKEREEAAKREAEFKKAAAEIIKRGGFVVESPVIKEVRGKKEVVGKQKVAVRLEKGKSPEKIVKNTKTGEETKKGGNEYWKVVEVFGATNGLKVGDTSPLDMRSFPYWFRESAKLYFRMHGKDFVERLVYESEE